MKCIHYYGTRVEKVKRVTDEEAQEAVSNGVARYVPKSLWKRYGRDAQSA